MTHTVPATAVLGPGKTGLTMGLRVLNLDGTTYSAFSTTGVSETSVLGTYRKANGAVVPDAGGYIVWGVSGTDYAEATVEGAAPTTAGILTAFGSAGNLDTQLGAIAAKTANLPASPAAVGSAMTLAANAVSAAALAADAGAEIASAVRTELATELGRIDAAVASRAAPGAAMALAANAVSAAALAADAGAEIASAVRTELATELGRIDAATSTRLATAGYTAPPSAATVASQVRTELTTELGRIDAATSSRAAPGDAMTLADDAITAAKYDQSTAFPLAQADAGSTAVARTGADSDTLETLSDQIDGVGAGSGLTAQEVRDAMKLTPSAGDAETSSIDDLIESIQAGSGLTAQETRDALKLAPSAGAAAAGSIDDLLVDLPATILTTVNSTHAGTPGTVAYLLSLLAGLDFTAVNLVAASHAGEITIKRTLTLAAVVSGLTIPADWAACYWTLKRSTDHADADALVQILVSNPPDAEDGLLTLVGVAPDDSSAGSIVVNPALGTVTIALDAASTAALEDAVELVWDVKVHAPGAKTQPGAGTATITTAVTRA